MHVTQWKIMVCVCAILMVCGVSSPAQELSMPVANKTVKNAVPQNLLQDIADMKAKKMWGQTICIAKIPCCDLKGDLTAYMFVYQHGKGPKKSFKEILAEVRQGRKDYEKAAKELSLAKQGLNLDAAGGADPSKPTQMNPTPEYVKAYKKLDAARKLKFGVGKYGYMVVNARYDRNPIPLTGHGLPCFFNRGDLIQKMARNSAGENAQLKRIYMAGALQRWYEFENAGKIATVDANSLKESDLVSIEKAMIHIFQRDGVDLRQKLYADKWRKLVVELNSGK